MTSFSVTSRQIASRKPGTDALPERFQEDGRTINLVTFVCPFESPIASPSFSACWLPSAETRRVIRMPTTQPPGLQSFPSG